MAFISIFGYRYPNLKGLYKRAFFYYSIEVSFVGVLKPSRLVRNATLYKQLQRLGAFTMDENKEVGNGRIYELGYLLVGSMAEADVPAKVGAIKGMIEAKGAQFISEEFPRQMTLAYEMSRSINNKKNWFTEGYFGWVKFEIEPAMAEALLPELKLDNDILRFLLIKTVRENTIAAKRGFTRGDFKRRDKKTETGEPTAPVDEAEIEKKLEELATTE